MDMDDPVFTIRIDHGEEVISLGNDEIGFVEICATSPRDMDWAESLRDYLELHGFTVDFHECD